MRSSPSTQPTGVVILVTLGAIFGIFAFMAGLSVFGFGAFVSTSAGFLGVLFSLLGFLVLVTGVLQIVVAYGAWLLRAWSWPLGVAVSLASVVLNALWVVAGAGPGLGLVAILAALASLYCLDSTTVRAALGRHSHSLLGGLTRRPLAHSTKGHNQLVRRPIRPSQDN